LTWADEQHQQTGDWPTADSGTIPGTDRETWRSVDRALQVGARSLPGGSSLARLLSERRGVRNRKDLPSLTEEQISTWVAAHRQRTGKWPTARSDRSPTPRERPGWLWTWPCGMPGGDCQAGHHSGSSSPTATV
jgi:hypothetical protein